MLRPEELDAAEAVCGVISRIRATAKAAASLKNRFIYEYYLLIWI
jgi:hypothetical protein